MAGAIVASALLALLLGCRESRPRPRPAPIVEPGPVAQQERARNEYVKNRPAAPSEYRVFPTPPRDNSFGEFADTRFRGLDSQPELPPLPADSYRPPAPAAAPAPFFGGPARPESPAAVPASLPAASQVRNAALPVSAAAGIQAGTHFYPVEQLVYGGDYPDIDRPELYRLMPKDVIGITVKDHPEFSGQMEIQPDGTVRVPNAPDLIRLRGLTTDEAAEAIRRVLAVYVKGECVVRVQANRARGGYYFVFGEVLQPGRFPMGMEPIKLSDAILAANWEANPARRDLDGDELGPSFPAASPRGKFLSPSTADLARVMLITPHRSQPVRTVHDVRSAMLGITANDPVVRPGQIVVVPSLLEANTRGAAMPAPPEALLPDRGFSTANSPARIPDVAPPRRGGKGMPAMPATPAPTASDVEANMMSAFDTSFNTKTDLYCPETSPEPAPAIVVRQGRTASGRGGNWVKGF